MRICVPYVEKKYIFRMKASAKAYIFLYSWDSLQNTLKLSTEVQ